MVIILLLPLNAYASEDARYEFSRFFHVKSLVKSALEKQSLEAAKYKKTKELQTSIVSSLTGSLLGIRQSFNNQFDFAVISNDLNNSEKLLAENILFVTIKLKYEDQKGQINWELSSVIMPERIDFYSVIDNNEEMEPSDLYAYKRLYKTNK